VKNLISVISFELIWQKKEKGRSSGKTNNFAVKKHLRKQF
jgi:hypothetical protein